MRAALCRLAVTLGAVAAAAACASTKVAFECTSDAECVDTDATGRCEHTGYCSFPDAECETGWRYGELAKAELAGECLVQCVTGLSLGAVHSCALLRGGRIACWGNGQYGRLGDGQDGGPTPYPVPIDPVVPPATAVAAGGGHTCALTEDGKVWCWGANDRLQLGEKDAKLGPVRVAAIDGLGVPITQVTAGAVHTCGRASVGTGCFGDDEYGQLGDGSAGPPQGPTLVAFKGSFQQVVAGHEHNCGRTIPGTVHCWGHNDAGQVGGASLTTYPTPVQVETPLRASALGLGLLHSCLVSSDQTVACWGNNKVSGQLGRPEKFTGSFKPVDITLPVDVLNVAAGAAHTCALGTDGHAWCWGSNSDGQLGPGRPISPFEPEPVEVVLPGAIVEIAAGALHTCARTDRDVVYCWGDNEFGQLGNGAIDADGQGEPDDAVTAALACQDD